MLALQFFGLGRGILAAAIISSYTYLAWNHPYAIITMTAEVAVVGWLSRRRKINLLMAILSIGSSSECQWGIFASNSFHICPGVMPCSS